MATPAAHSLKFDQVRNFGRLSGEFALSDLTQIQTESYARFLQLDADPKHRKPHGLEEIMREIFPISSYDGQHKLDFVKYELGKPRYTPVECRQLRLTYGRPFRVWLRLVKEQPIEEEVYLGDMPIMLGGGEFIINGAERVVVSQLHRSPGVDFVLSSEPGEKKNYSCRIIPERGSWIELVVSKKEALGVRIDQSGKFSAMTLLRAMSPDYSTDSALIRLFYETAKVKVSKGDHAELIDKVSVEDVVYPIKDERSGEIIVECGHVITEAHANAMAEAGIRSVEVVPKLGDALVLNSIMEDRAGHQAVSKEMTPSHESALLRIYQRLRPGNPPQLEKATDLFKEKFFDVNRYRLGRVGRFRINRKFNQDIPDSEMTLRAEDFVNAIRYLVRLRSDDQRSQ